MSIFRQTTRFILCTTIILLHTSCFQQKSEPVKPAILPIPLSQQVNDGVFVMDSSTGIYTEAQEFKSVVDFLKTFVQEGTSKIDLVALDFKNVIYLKKTPLLKMKRVIF